MAFWIVANWKMNLSSKEAQALAHMLTGLPHTASIIVCPPFVWLQGVHQMIASTPHIALGAQDCSTHSHGSFTGEISAAMLKDCGATHVLIGHSERRSHHHEDHQMIRQKMDQAWREGLTPILCIGEHRTEEREHTLAHQLDVLKGYAPAQRPLMIAYEPVWAIGTGKASTPQDLEQALEMIRAWHKREGQPIPPLLYGGSVTSDNAAQYRFLCDGLLVGGASLKAQTFQALVACLIS